VTLLIYPNFGVNPTNGLGDPSIGSWSCFRGVSAFVSGLGADGPRARGGLSEAWVVLSSSSS
jgi:hypothetical protein